MRESCLECAMKHIAKASILMDEAELGYPFHKAYAIGNLSEAEEECLGEYKELAERIREIRLRYTEGGRINMDLLMIEVYGMWKAIK